MTTNFTPHATNAPLTSTGINGPLTELDNAIVTLQANFKIVRLTADDVTDQSAILQAAADAAAYGQAIYVLSSDPTKRIAIATMVTFAKPGTRLIGLNTGTSNTTGCHFLATANFGAGNSMFQWKATLTSTTMEGIGAENFNVDMNNKTGHGITVYKAYNSASFQNIRVRNVADAYSAWRFTYQSGASASERVSQGIIAQNLWGQHYADTSTAPTFLIARVQESTFINCKGWGGAGLNEAGHWPWQVQDCRGVQFYGCSAAASAKGGWNIISTLTESQNIGIIDPTFELCGLSPTRAAYVRTGGPEGTATYSAVTAYVVNDLVVDVAGGDLYVCIQNGTGQTPSSSPTFWTQLNIKRISIRNPRQQIPVFAQFDFDQLVNSAVETTSAIALLSANCDNNHVISERSDLVTMGGGVGNTMFGYAFFQSGKHYAPTMKVTNPGTAALVSAIYLGSTLIGTGTGSPEGVITAPVGSIYMRTDNANSLYVKQTLTGNTGWVLK